MATSSFKYRDELLAPEGKGVLHVWDWTLQYDPGATPSPPDEVRGHVRVRLDHMDVGPSSPPRDFAVIIDLGKSLGVLDIEASLCGVAWADDAGGRPGAWRRAARTVFPIAVRDRGASEEPDVLEPHLRPTETMLLRNWHSESVRARYVMLYFPYFESHFSASAIVSLGEPPPMSKNGGGLFVDPDWPAYRILPNAWKTYRLAT